MTDSTWPNLHPLFKNPDVAVAAGAVFLLIGAWCFRDAYESRGRKRPALVSWLGM